jgi:RHS repeat-associated protein
MPVLLFCCVSGAAGGTADLPLSFEPNQGQWNSGIRFLARVPGWQVALTDRSAIIRGSHNQLQMDMLGAHPSAPQGEDAMEAVSHYFTGSDPRSWRANVRHVRRVRYRNIYPGIDAVFYGNPKSLEYDLIVAPQADPANIRFQFHGVKKLQIDEYGDLLIGSGSDALRQRKPRIYQEVNGARREIGGGYALLGAQRVGFRLDAFDHSQPLVIDPVLLAQATIGGTLADHILAVAEDAQGFVYVAGSTLSTDFPVTGSSTYQGNTDAFVAKLNPGMTSLIYSTYLGGTGFDEALQLAVDSNGNVHVVGDTSSTNFPATSGAIQATAGGNGDGFLSVFDPNGNLQYSTYLGGQGTDVASAIVVDSAGNRYIAGTASTGFPVTSDALQKTCAGPVDAFYAKIDASNHITYATFLGGSAADVANALALDSNGNIYLAGLTNSTDLPVTSGVLQRTYGGGSTDGFVAEISANGKTLLYATYLGGRDQDALTGIAVAADGSAYVAGSTASDDLHSTPDAFQLKYGGGGDALFAKLNPTGTTLLYLTYVGGSGPDFGAALAAAPDGTLYMALGSSSSGFSPDSQPAMLLFQFAPAPQPAAAASLADSLASSGTRPASITSSGTGSVFLIGAGDPTSVQGDPDVGGYRRSRGNSVGHGCPPPHTSAIAGLDIRFTGARDSGSCDDQGITSRVETIPKPDQSAGNTPNAQKQGDPVSTATGELTDEFTDLSLGGPLPLRFRRTYASLLFHNGLFSSLGVNWMHNFESYISVLGGNATVILYPGERIPFTQAGSAWHIAPGQTYNHQLLVAGDGSYRFLDIRTSRIYTFSPPGQLTRIEDRNGNAITLTYAPNSVFLTRADDGLGRTLSFSYTGGNLTSVQDQAGRTVQFGYNSQLLAAATDPLGKTTTYGYTSAGSYLGLLTTITEPAGNTILQQQYDSQGRVLTQSDAFGNATHFDYSQAASGFTRVIDPTGASNKYTHANFNWTAAEDALGASASFSYDSRSRPTTSTDRTGNSTTLAYDAVSGLPSSVTNELGDVTVYTWTPQAQGGFTFYNLTRIDYVDGTSTAYTYDASGNFLTYKPSGGKTLSFSYNSRGQYLTAHNAADGVYQIGYNQDGNLASVQSPSGSQLQYSYDTLKRLTQIQRVNGGSRSWIWDADDRATSITFENGKSIQLGYDDNGRLASFTNRSGKTTSVAFNGNDAPTQITDPLGQSYKFQYDARGQVSGLSDPTGVSTAFTYDGDGNVIRITDATGQSQGATYDAEGRQTSYTDPLGRVTQFHVDKMGHLVGMTTASGAVYTRTFNGMDRVTSLVDPDGLTSTYGFDPRGMLNQIVYPGSRTLKLTWDDTDNLTTLTDPLGSLWQRTYDNASRLLSEKDPAGNTVTYGYDASDHVNAVSYPGGSVQITYDNSGNVISKAFSGGLNLTYTYDDSGRPSGGSGLAISHDANGDVSGSNGLTITRDGAGRLASVTYAPGKTVNYSYDKRALLTTVSDWAGGVTSFAYDVAQQLISVTRSNGVVTQFTYDLDGRLASRSDVLSGTILGSISVTRAPSGRITSENRQVPQGPEPAPGTLGLQYDSAQQLATGAKYDGLGRISNDALLAYQWDAASRLTSYSGSSGHASFTYDAFGGRTSRTGSDGQTLNYLLNYGLPLVAPAVVRNSGGELRYYVFLPNGGLLYSLEAKDNSRRFFHFDFTGSTTFLTDDAGAVTDSYGITPYGESVTHNGPSTNPFTYLGQLGVMQEESTGLYYMRLRYYDSSTARFLSRDPEEVIDPVHVNPYQYSSQDPLSHVDPNGLDDKKQGDKPIEDAQKKIKDVGDRAKKFKDASDTGAKWLDEFAKQGAKDGPTPKTAEDLKKIEENVQDSKKLKDISKGLDKGAKIADAAGKALTVIEKGMELNDKINRSEDERDNNTNLNELNRDQQYKNIRDLYNKGRFSKAQYDALKKQIDDAFRTSQEATESNQVVDLAKAGAEFVDETLTSLVSGKGKAVVDFIHGWFKQKDPTELPPTPPPPPPTPPPPPPAPQGKPAK